MTRTCRLKAICLLVLLMAGALPALAQQDRHDEQDEVASPGALAQYRKGERLAKKGQFTEAIVAYRQAITPRAGLCPGLLRDGPGLCRPEAVS